MNQERRELITALLARANETGRKVYGFNSDKASCSEPPKKVIPDEWKFACVEGDKTWTRLPSDE